jgi:predicted RNA-binding protein YlxR (DUF448 family)
VPQRTCVACRETGGKRVFIRVVLTGEGVAEVDSSGKKPGRGAYLCGRRTCWETALKKGSLEHALRTKISAENRQELAVYAQMMPEEAQNGG